MLQIQEREEKYLRKQEVEIMYCVPETVTATGFGYRTCVLACPQVRHLHKKIFAWFGYRKCSSVQSRAGFKCQHVRRGCGAPAGQGGAEVSWCVHANPCRHPVSLIQVLSEKSESTCHRSDILNNSISSPCVALGSAHALSRWTLNICCLCCQLPATPCPSAKTSCKSLSFQSGRTE